LNPIQGLELAPSLSLKESLTHAQNGDEELASHNFNMNLFCASTFAENHTDPELTEEDVSIIHFYTQETPFYKILNSRLRNSDRQILKPYFPILKLMITAIRKIPPAKITLYRGVKLNLLEKYNKLKNKREIWWSFGSTTESVNVLQNETFLGKSGPRSMFVIQSQTARDISNYSAMQGEKEFILLPGSVFVVDGVLDSGVTIVTLKEIIPDWDILPVAAPVPIPKVKQQPRPASVTLPSNEKTGHISSTVEQQIQQQPQSHSLTLPSNGNMGHISPTVEQQPQQPPQQLSSPSLSWTSIIPGNHPRPQNPAPILHVPKNTPRTGNNPIPPPQPIPVAINVVIWGEKFKCINCDNVFKFVKRLARAENQNGYGYGAKAYLETDHFHVLGKKFENFILRSTINCPICNHSIQWVDNINTKK
jgi:hypothetical protein